MQVIQTASGRYFDLATPRPADICLSDIAHALSNLCRFNGHTAQFYSVAQHSVIVSQIAPPELAFAALMHDAHEAYVGDVTSPIKALLPSYRILERVAARCVRRCFGVPLVMPIEVQRADLIALATEKRDIMSPLGGDWTCLHGIEPLPGHILPLSPLRAHALFVDRFRELLPKEAAA
jgi:hypothetical protein